MSRLKHNACPAALSRVCIFLDSHHAGVFRAKGYTGPDLTMRTSLVLFINHTRLVGFGLQGVSPRMVKKLDVGGFEPSTSRMQSVRATTVPNAHIEMAIQIQ